MTVALSAVAAVLALLGHLLGPVPRGTWPLHPRPPVVRGFDPPASPWGAGHRGVDLLGRRGQAVHAARAGRIVFAGRLAGRGVVVVDHGQQRTTYEPVSAAVHTGQTVAQGQRIGSLQSERSHCSPRVCLHWGLLRGRVYLNPLLLVGGGPVRLLPQRGAPPAGVGPPSASGLEVGRAPRSVPGFGSGAARAGRAVAEVGAS